jgi:uncharacterized protein YciI
MLYAIIGKDRADSLEQRLAVRPQHLQRIEQLQRQGRLIIAGPLPAIDSNDPGAAGFQGSLIVAEFSDLAAARAWAETDPYTSNGVFAAVEVFPFKQVFPG